MLRHMPSIRWFATFNRVVAAAVCSCVVVAALLAAADEPPESKSAAAGANRALTAADDKDHAAKMAQGLVLFKKHVRSVLVAHCVKRHGGEAVESEFDLTDRDKLLRGGSSGKVAEPGKAKSGRMYERITHARKPGMPFKGEKLADETIARI